MVFVDDGLFGDALGVSRVMIPPVKRGRVLEAKSPRLTRFGSFGTVHRIGREFHLWFAMHTIKPHRPYERTQYLCHARSDDGLSWEREGSGSADAFAGAEPGIVMGMGAGGVAGTVGDCTNVFAAPDAPRASRWRMAMKTETAEGGGMRLFGSPDGVHWRAIETEVLAGAARHPHATIVHDDSAGKFLAYARRNVRTAAGARRIVVCAEGATLADLPPVAEMEPVVFRGAEKSGSAPGSAEVSSAEAYSAVVARAPGTSGWWMFPSYFRSYAGRGLREFAGPTPANAGMLEVRLAGSRDGTTWNTFEPEPYLRNGLRGAWDSRRLHFCHGLVELGRDRTLLFYLGTDRCHGWDLDADARSQLRKAGLAPAGEPSGIGLLEARRDGFIAARAGLRGGTFITPAMRCPGGRLVLNVDTSTAGEVRVEILDTNSGPLPGFRRDDADPIHSANEMDRRVSWRGRFSLDGLAGTWVRLRFVLIDADLYAFQFKASGAGVGERRVPMSLPGNFR